MLYTVCAPGYILTHVTVCELWEALIVSTSSRGGQQWTATDLTLLLLKFRTCSPFHWVRSTRSRWDTELLARLSNITAGGVLSSPLGLGMALYCPSLQFISMPSLSSWWRSLQWQSGRHAAGHSILHTHILHNRRNAKNNWKTISWFVSFRIFVFIFFYSELGCIPRNENLIFKSLLHNFI